MELIVCPCSSVERRNLYDADHRLARVDLHWMTMSCRTEDPDVYSMRINAIVSHATKESLTQVEDEQGQVVFPELLAICPILLSRAFESSSDDPTLAVRVRSLVVRDSVYRTIRRRTSVAFEPAFVAKAKNNMIEIKRTFSSTNR